ncbi:hypothetical protein [Maritalea sp.]|uniref:hypothetical protein n=1 Tax=Maritalea sp. TaxID=2003361 RepID=UPI003EFB2BB2
MKSRTEMREQLFRQSELLFSEGGSLADESNALEPLRTFQPIDPKRADVFSNLFLFWESIPKYCIHGHEQANLRSEEGFMETVEKEFPIDEVITAQSKMVMHPARLQDPKTLKWKEHFPTFFDEKIERVLIKLFLDRDRGGFERIDDEYGALVRFRIREIRRILADSGAGASHADVIQSLRVLSGTKLEIFNDQGASHKESIFASLTEPQDTNSYFVVRFNTIVSTAIRDRSYRQFPFEQWMKLRSSLSRWLLLRMSTQRNLGMDVPHKVKASIAAAAGVCAAKRPYDRSKAFYKALAELKEVGVVTYDEKSDIQARVIRERGAMVDIEFSLYPSNGFVSHVIAANGRDSYLRARQAHAKILNVKSSTWEGKR